jgi:hypothetical protein
MKHIKLFEEFINESQELQESYLTVKLSYDAAKSFQKELDTNKIKYSKLKPTVFAVEDTPKANMAIRLTKERFNSNEILVENSESSYDFGCVMLYFDFPMMSKIQDGIDPQDLYEEEGDKTYGFEDEPHVTLLYGLKDSVTLENVKEIIDSFTFDSCVLHNMSLFENEYDVLKFDVKGDQLHEANKALRELPYENNYPDYHPHCTIAYLKKGKGSEYCKKMGDLEYELKPSYAVFSQPNGTKTKIDINTK